MATCWSKTRPCCKCVRRTRFLRGGHGTGHQARCCRSRKLPRPGSVGLLPPLQKPDRGRKTPRQSCMVRSRRRRKAMEMRVFGRTGMRLSVLGFGCGAVGGLMVRGDPRDQERTIARAIATGVNYFDTAVQYGNGESEKNLGRVLQKLKPADVTVGTKVRLPSADVGDIAGAVAKS